MDGLKYTQEQLQGFVLHSLMDSIYANIYITDVDTDEIIFMSKGLKEAYKIEEPEGKTCWQVLKNGMEGRCPSCPIDKLKKMPGENPSLVWEEYNSLSGKVYEIYDMLTTWIDKRVVHLQHRIDVTEYKQLSIDATMDELTNILNRKAGKAALQKVLDEVQKEQSYASVCLYDLNGLKQINDNYGHLEGDKILTMIAQLTAKNIGVEDIVFRLSGDEFIVIFRRIHKDEAVKKMLAILNIINERAKELPYEVSFCFGIIEVGVTDTYLVSDVLQLVDEQMYTHKRFHHIKKAQSELAASPVRLAERVREFDYDKEHLYDALARSTDAYIFVGNMQTGTFRYSPGMVEEFGLPGEIIPNAAAVWGERIHPDDKASFLESNQSIADGREDCHCIQYRARDKKGNWIRLQCRGSLIRDDRQLPKMFAGMITHIQD